MNQLRYSANLGFLWHERPLVERIERAAAAGFDLVEFHDEAQRHSLSSIRQALSANAVGLVALNVRMGTTSGCAALVGHAAQAREDIDQAICTAEALGAGALHVLSGKSRSAAAHNAYMKSLSYALEQTELTILIEPISLSKMPGYYLHDLDMAARVVGEMNHDRLRILFDCFHVREQHGADVAGLFRQHADTIGHVQIASWPARAEPGCENDALDFARLLPGFRAAGYTGAFGCEYHPTSSVEAGLGWRNVIARKIQAITTD